MLEIVLLHDIGESATRLASRVHGVTVSATVLDAYLDKRTEWNVARPGELAPSRPSYLLTFDDGYKSTISHALPLLERYEARAVVFVTTAFIDGTTYPHELELASVVESHTQLKMPDGTPLECSRFSDKVDVYMTLRRRLSAASARRREDELSSLARANRYARPDYQHIPFLSWDDVRELDRHPLISLGAHSNTHVSLTRRSPATAYREIVSSKRRLEAAIGHEVGHFSYPYGRSNWIVRQIVAKAGFAYAYTTEERAIKTPEDVKVLAIPRLDIRTTEHVVCAVQQ